MSRLVVSAVAFRAPGNAAGNSSAQTMQMQIDATKCRWRCIGRFGRCEVSNTKRERERKHLKTYFWPQGMHPTIGRWSELSNRIFVASYAAVSRSKPSNTLLIALYYYFDFSLHCVLCLPLLFPFLFIAFSIALSLLLVHLLSPLSFPLRSPASTRSGPLR